MPQQSTWACDGPGCSARHVDDVLAPPPAGWITLERLAPRPPAGAALVDVRAVFHTWACLAAWAAARRDGTALVPDPLDQVAQAAGYRDALLDLAARAVGTDAGALLDEAEGRGPAILADTQLAAELDQLRKAWATEVAP